MVQLNFDVASSLSFLFSFDALFYSLLKASSDCSTQNEHLFPEINDCSPLDGSYNAIPFASYFHLFFHEFDVMQRVSFPTCYFVLSTEISI